MALKDLLVYLDQTDRASMRLRLAADLARRHSSRLTGLYVREWSEAQLEHRRTAELAGRSFSEIEQLDREAKANLDHRGELLRSELVHLAQHYGLETEWRSVDGPPSLVVPQHARCADLCVLGEDASSNSASFGYSFAEEMLFITGRPVLFVPAAGEFASLGRHILIAWNSSRAAARAVNDALSLIERAERVTVLSINAADYIGRHGGLPTPHLIEHFRQHGTRAEEQSVKDVPIASIAHAIQAQAAAVGADLIVAGAYGHARLREKLLGGVTHDLLAHMSLPLMMSH